MKTRHIFHLSLLLTLLAYATTGLAQFPGGKDAGKMLGQLGNVARLYGKVLDAKTKKPVEFASVALLWFDKDSAIAGELAKPNGDFSLEKLPFGGYRIRVSFIGYKTYEEKIFINFQNLDKDLGNIMLEQDVALLKEVTVTEEKAQLQMAIDRKIFNVDKDISARGGTALDVMKNVPTVNVDVDGNATLRNTGVTIYVDGRPTTLQLQQIPADQIDRIEVITNPSVKFEAAATGGIINIVLKKNAKPGYNGMVMGGIGTGDRYNGMINLNVKENPWNFSLMYNFNSATNRNNGWTKRTDLSNGNVTSYYDQTTLTRMQNAFHFGRLAVDYNINNRNVITLAANVMAGDFRTLDNQKYSILNADKSVFLTGERVNKQPHGFQNYTGQILYKKTFPKQGQELTADLNYNHSFGNGNYLYSTYLYDNTGSGLTPILQRNTSNSGSNMYTFQLDYVNPISETKKIEMGIRSNYKLSTSQQNTYNALLGSDYVIDTALTNDYKIGDMVNAAYVNYISKIWGINYQAGLRFEHTYYDGLIRNKNLRFAYQYPTNAEGLKYAFFPGIYLTKKLPKNQEVQLNFARKIERPNFFQTMPFIMFADQRNIRIGNPQLRPEFINLSELNYNFVKGKFNWLTSAYFRYREQAITNVAYPSSTDSSILINTFQNGNNSYSYGWENTLKMTFFKNLDLTLNGNVFFTEVSWTNAGKTETNRGYAWFGKTTISYKFPKDITLQINGNYESPKILPQGVTQPMYFIDLSLNYMYKMKWIFNASVSDLLNSKRMGTHYDTPYYVQDLSRRRESRFFKVSVSYLFGKFDVSIFRQMRGKKGGQQGGGNQDGLDF